MVPEKFVEYGQLDEKDKGLVSARVLQLAKKCAKTSTKEGSAREHGEVRIDVTTKSKDERKLYHDFIRWHFTHLDTSTVTDGDKKFVVVPAKKKLPLNEWPQDRPKYLTFYLRKESIDTSQVTQTRTF